MAIVVDTTAEAVRTGRLDERRRRRMRARTIRLNETALMVQSQIEDKADPAMLWPGVTSEQLAPWLFDAELADRMGRHRGSTSGRRLRRYIPPPPASNWSRRSPSSRGRSACRRPAGFEQAASQAQRILDQQPTAHRGRRPRRRRRTPPRPGDNQCGNGDCRSPGNGRGAATGRAPPPASDSVAPAADDAAGEQEDSGLRQTTRQAIQVAVAASLAIVIGELVSPSRWFWAVIAAFVIFAGTNSWGETLTKGWQRLLGTMLGVPCGVLVATLFSGNKTASLAAIFVCLFCAFYFMTVTYSLMTFWITTMLALLYGLLGEFSFGVLLLRIEETAIGAVIGVTVAILVLPTNTRTAIRDDTRAFLASLSALIEISTETMFGRDETASPTEQARELDRNLQQFRVTAKPLVAGVAGLASRRSIRRGLRLFAACDRYGRSLARSAEQYQDPVGSEPLAHAFTSAAAQTHSNIDALVAIIDGAVGVHINSTTDELDAAETVARHQHGGAEPSPDTRRFLTAVHALRQIERAVVTGATNLGARDGVNVPTRPRAEARGSVCCGIARYPVRPTRRG